MSDVDLVKVHRAMTEAGRTNEQDRQDRIKARNDAHVAAGGRICGGCTRPATAVYMNGPSCDLHSPAALRGVIRPLPDPALTMEGLRRAWYVEQGLPYQPMMSPLSSSAAIDDRNIVRGKKSASDARTRQARAR